MRRFASPVLAAAIALSACASGYSRSTTSGVFPLPEGFQVRVRKVNAVSEEERRAWIADYAKERECSDYTIVRKRLVPTSAGMFGQNYYIYYDVKCR